MPPTILYDIDYNTNWTTKHENVHQPIEYTYFLRNPDTQDIGDNIFIALQQTVSSIQSILEQAKNANVRLRAFGSKWSLSACAATNGRMLHTKNLNWSFGISKESVSSSYIGDRSNLYYMQSGITIRRLNEKLKERKRSLQAMGGSNGQTIAGAISTGTHGSAFNVGSLHDSVVALQIITSPEKNIWLERASYPVISDSFAKKMGVKIVRDDALFNSALVSFGSFGFIFGVMIEAIPIYLLRSERKKIAYDHKLKATMNTLDFSKIEMPYPNETPYHFEVVFNPHDISGGAYVTTMYKRIYHTNYIPPEPIATGLGPGDDLLCVVGRIGDVIPGAIKFIMNSFASQLYKDSLIQWGTIGEIFHSTDAEGKATSAEIGIPIHYATQVFDIIMDINENKEGFPGFISFRYVKGSKATLAFTKFDISCTIEFPATLSSSALSFYNYLWDALDQSGIPYTFHWGQENNLSPEKVRSMYETNVDVWTQSRKTLLEEPYRKIFSSPFLEKCGLDN